MTHFVETLAAALVDVDLPVRKGPQGCLERRWGSKSQAQPTRR
jgi:hypothetical protein